jgi:hypothetical protein
MMIMNNFKEFELVELHDDEVVGGTIFSDVGR